ncbi:hypothetical protein [Fodinicola feengrottensis]|uniref:hypothetical protein n=1 Tax=Fodinicola feengrottensis TaxID=435914 RepID=UPI0024419790|nr:hypothetical protein [Fodinicola feengrottensis]
MDVEWGNELEYDATPGVKVAGLGTAIATDLQRFGLSRHPRMQDYHAAMLAEYSHRRDTWSVQVEDTAAGELPSPILPYGPGKWRESWYDIALAYAVIRRNGGVFSTRTGSHIHVSVKSFDQQPRLLMNLLLHVRHRLDLLYRVGANGRHHRGIQFATPLDQLPAEEASWEEIAHLASSALSLTPLLGSIGDPERDHVELRIPDGIDAVGHLQFLVRVLQRLVKLSAVAGPDNYRPQQLGHHFDGRVTDADSAGLAQLLELFAPAASAVHDQARAVWQASSWQKGNVWRREAWYGVQIGTKPDGMGTYGAVSAKQHQRNIAALLRTTDGMDQPVVVFHHVSRRDNVAIGASNFGDLEQILREYHLDTPRALVVLFEPRGSDAIRAADELALAQLADRRQILLVRPYGVADVVTAGPDGLSSPGGWSVREPGGRLRRLASVLRRDELDELAARTPEAALAELADSVLWERLAGEPGEGGVRCRGDAPTTVPPVVARTGAVAAGRGRPLVVMRPDRTGPGGVRRFSVARLDALHAMLTDDPTLARTGVLLVGGDPLAIEQVRREHRMATIFELAGDSGRSVRSGWRLVSSDGQLLWLGEDVDRTTIQRSFDHLDEIHRAEGSTASASPVLSGTDAHREAAQRIRTAVVEVGFDRVGACEVWAGEAVAAIFKGGVRVLRSSDDLGVRDGAGRLTTSRVLATIPDREFVASGSFADLRHRVVKAGPGAVAAILMGRPGTAGHAAVAWYDGSGLVVRDDEGREQFVADGSSAGPHGWLLEADLRSAVFDRRGVLQSAPPAEPESGSTVRTLLDPPSVDEDGIPYTGGGLEFEALSVTAVPAGQTDLTHVDMIRDSADDNENLVGWGDHYKIVLDNGWRREVLADGSWEQMSVSTFEFVTDRYATVPGERGSDGLLRPEFEQVWASYRRGVEAFFAIPRYTNWPLVDLQTPESGITLSRFGQRLGALNEGRPTQLSQWTWGVPLDKLSEILGVRRTKLRSRWRTGSDARRQ